MSYSPCPESVMGSHSVDRNGKCTWCNRPVSGYGPMPTRLRHLYDDQEAVINPITLEPEEWPYEGRD